MGNVEQLELVLWIFLLDELDVLDCDTDLSLGAAVDDRDFNLDTSLMEFEFPRFRL